MIETFRVNGPDRRLIEAAFSGIAQGNMGVRFGPAESVRENRAELYKYLGLPTANVVCIRSQAEDRIIDLSEVELPADENGDVAAFCDGLITNHPNQGLALFPADCIPMVLYSHLDPVVGLIHGARTSAEMGIHTDSVSRLVDHHGVAVSDIRVHLGPSIQPQSYRYESLDEGLANDERWIPHRTARGKQYFLDLPGFIIEGLGKSGISPVQISRSNADTGAENSKFFSHRRSQLTGEAEGRNGALVVLKRS